MGGLTRRTMLAGGAAGTVSTPGLAHTIAIAAVGQTTSIQPTIGQALAIRRARAAHAFISSIGVDIHLNTPAYAGQFEIVAQRLHELGLKHVREGFSIGNAGFTRLNAIVEATGIQATLISSPTANTAEFVRDTILHRLGKQAVAAVEGINEPDGWFSAQPAAHGDWVAETVQHQRELYQAIKSTPSIADIAVLGPAVIDVDNVDRLAGTLPFCDVLNMHPYPGAWNPETAGWGGPMRGFEYGSLDWAEANTMRRLRPTMPVMATETGYHNAVDSKSPHFGVPEWVSAIYLPRLFLYYFRKGVARTFSYELLDEGDDKADLQACFGLLRHDGSRKPAFVALRNLIAMLADPGPNRPAGGLEMTLTGSDDPIETLLLQKSDGTFYLAAWLPRQVWDPAARIPKSVALVTVRLGLGQEVEEIAVGKPNSGTDWRTVATAVQTVDVEIGAAVTLVRLRPHVDENTRVNTGPAASPAG